MIDDVMIFKRAYPESALHQLYTIQYFNSHNYETSAFSTDTDKDGIDDIWQLTYFRDLYYNAPGDYDNDGFSNYFEYRYDSSPLDSDYPKNSIFSSNEKSKIQYRYDSLGRIKSITRMYNK